MNIINKKESIMSNKQGYHEPPGPEGVAPKHSKTALDTAAKKKAAEVSNAEVVPRKTINLINNRTADVTGFIDLDSPEFVAKNEMKFTPEMISIIRLKDHLRHINAKNVEIFYRIEPIGSKIGLPDNTILYSARYKKRGCDDHSKYVEVQWNSWEADIAESGPRKYTITPEMKQKSRREMLYNSAHSLLPEIHYNAPKSEIINGDIYVGKLIVHHDLREALVEGWTLKVIYPKFAEEWIRVKNVGNIGLLSGKCYTGYSKEKLIIEDFKLSATNWINDNGFKIAIKSGHITQEEADSRIKFFEDLFKR